MTTPLSSKGVSGAGEGLPRPSWATAAAERSGHVILLNGTPSAGKTTIARALWNELEPPHWYRSLDDFRQGYQERHWRSDPRALFDLVFRGFVRSIREMALAGHDVITEAVMLPGNTDAYLDALAGIRVYLVGVRCPLELAQRRERERTDRLRGPIELAIPDFDLVHADRPYDVEFDTSAVSVADAVALIRAAVLSGKPPTAFDLLRSARRSRPRVPPGERMTELQDLIDRSGRNAGPHLRRTFELPDHALSAAALVRYWGSGQTVALATLGRDGTPRLAPVDSLLRGTELWVPTASDAARVRHVAARPQVAFTHWVASRSR